MKPRIIPATMTTALRKSYFSIPPSIVLSVGVRLNDGASHQQRDQNCRKFDAGLDIKVVITSGIPIDLAEVGVDIIHDAALHGVDRFDKSSMPAYIMIVK